MMRSKLKLASGIAVAATMMTAILGAAESGAAAEQVEPRILREGQARITTEEAETLEISHSTHADSIEPVSVRDKEPLPQAPSSLSELAAAQNQPEALSDELHCLAGAIYFEARSEPLSGQLAVGRVVVRRARSGRFPQSYCGVVFQPAQFSFAHGDRMPAIGYTSLAWKDAVAIAQIADAGSWQSPVEGALYFHASRVSPGWHLKRLARIGNHIFYR